MLKNNEPIWFNTKDKEMAKTQDIRIVDVKPDKEPLKIFVATPVHDMCTIHYTRAVLLFQQECMKKGVLSTYSLLKSSLVQQGRNLCVSEFLSADMKYDYFLFIDSDIDFSPETIFTMIEKNKDVIACPYPMKTLNWDKIWRRLHSEAIDKPDHLMKAGFTFPIKVKDTKNISVNDGVCEVTHAPTGCMLIKRSVFEKMVEKYPELKINQTTIINGKEATKPNFYNFFDTYHDPETQEFYGEDFGFCKRWTDIGGKLYLYIMDYITHVGEYSYCGRMWDELQYNARVNKRVDEDEKIK